MVLTNMTGFSSWDLDATSMFVSAVLPDDELVYMETIPGVPLPKGKCWRTLPHCTTWRRYLLPSISSERGIQWCWLSTITDYRVMTVFLFDMKSMSVGF
jgi:hypothetical protein